MSLSTIIKTDIAMIEFRRIGYVAETLSGGLELPRHRHLDAYATIVIDGAYEQNGYAGRLRVRAGDVLIQPTLDCHINHMLSHGVRLQRLPWPREIGLGGVFSVDGLDHMLAMALTDVAAASAMLMQAVQRSAPITPAVQCLSDLLAADLANDPALCIGEWAERAGIARESATRSFSRSFGVSPARFGAELRARSAWLHATGSRERLCAVAADIGFCDQAHMTRAVRRLTGSTPAKWRNALCRE